MTTTPVVELVYFGGCPHADSARANVRAALDLSAVKASLTEWDQRADDAPDRVRGFGSPTVLINGRDITGVGRATGATCRAEGAPSVDRIRRALAEMT